MRKASEFYKAVLQYIVLVGLPILGVIALLQVGKHIQPPVSVGGTWKLGFNGQGMGTLACRNFPVWSDDPQLTISQSGRHLELSLNDDANTSLIGKVEGMSFIARQNPNLDKDPGTQLTAEIDRQAKPDRLAITMSSSQCAATQTLVAIRQTSASSVSGGY